MYVYILQDLYIYIYCCSYLSCNISCQSANQYLFGCFFKTTSSSLSTIDGRYVLDKATGTSQDLRDALQHDCHWRTRWWMNFPWPRNPMRSALWCHFWWWFLLVLDTCVFVLSQGLSIQRWKQGWITHSYHFICLKHTHIHIIYIYIYIYMYTVHMIVLYIISPHSINRGLPMSIGIYHCSGGNPINSLGLRIRLTLYTTIISPWWLD